MNICPIKEEEVQASIEHVLVYYYFFFILNTKPQKLNKISVLEFGNENSFILELYQALPRTS